MLAEHVHPTTLYPLARTPGFTSPEQMLAQRSGPIRVRIIKNSHRTQPLTGPRAFAQGSEEPRGGANSVHFLREMSSAHREQL